MYSLDEIHQEQKIEEERMAKYVGMDSILQAALGEFADYGFRLEEPDDHFTELYFKDKKIAIYNSVKLTIPVLHEGCRNFLKSLVDARLNDAS